MTPRHQRPLDPDKVDAEFHAAAKLIYEAINPGWCDPFESLTDDERGDYYRAAYRAEKLFSRAAPEDVKFRIQLTGHTAFALLNSDRELLRRRLEGVPGPCGRLICRLNKLAQYATFDAVEVYRAEGGEVRELRNVDAPNSESVAVGLWPQDAAYIEFALSAWRALAARLLLLEAQA